MEHSGYTFTNNGDITSTSNTNNTGIRVDNGTITNKYNAGKGVRIAGTSSNSTGMAALNSNF